MPGRCVSDTAMSRRRDTPPCSLALGELEPLASLLAPVLLRFFFTRIARQETVAPQRLAQRFVHLEQRTSNPMTHSAGLPRNFAAFALDVDVDRRERLRDVERLPHDHLQRRPREVLVDGTLVDGDDALAEREAHAGDAALAAAGALKYFLRLHLGERLRLLGGMRMVRTGVDVEAPELDVAHAVGREHSANGALDEALGILVAHLGRRLGPQTAWVAGVAMVDFLGPLPRRELDLVRVDDHDVVAVVDVRGPGRLGAAGQGARDLHRERAEPVPGRVDD